jgi:hypothetical protein
MKNNHLKLSLVSTTNGKITMEKIPGKWCHHMSRRVGSKLLLEQILSDITYKF